MFCGGFCGDDSSNGKNGFCEKAPESAFSYSTHISFLNWTITKTQNFELCKIFDRRKVEQLICPLHVVIRLEYQKYVPRNSGTSGKFDKKRKKTKIVILSPSKFSAVQCCSRGNQRSSALNHRWNSTVQRSSLALENFRFRCVNVFKIFRQ